ncbi:cob(I)yrinic acid a,c-diamide adenosyltransferase [Hydrogenimonas urashimensis]|uniref:cob(I)yrinic acid a,c-diamide adenosyltransferase n=1 Tax=Hydrogenimonas urashimensis TaxID=2740515 RepID=UPI0019153CD2|nr:cob(I)yrinic acid a,c-diamide adenosyltransferase [Hydrogenimonas urashimensis]
MKKGQIQLYTGDGKGKTTAAVGLTLRAVGEGMRVLFVQFMKSVPSGEIEMLKRCGGSDVEILRNWDDSFIIGKPSAKQIAMCHDLWKRVRRKIDTFKPDILVLDEIAVAISYGLVDEDTVLEFLKNRPQSLEVVMTGRDASERLIASSTLVTEMRKIKHYYDQGVMARKGIEY